MPRTASRGSIGGASGDAGVEYRRGVAAYAVAHGLASVPLKGFGPGTADASVSAVVLETDDPVDDIRIEFHSGAATFVQAKRSLTPKPFRKAVEQWVKAGQGELRVGEDHLVIAAATLPKTLRLLGAALERNRGDIVGELTSGEGRQLERLKSLLRELDPAAIDRVLRCGHIVQLEVEEDDEVAARESALLLGHLVDTSDASDTWLKLKALAGRAARRRHGFEVEGWFELLRRDGVTFKASDGTIAGDLTRKRDAVARLVRTLKRRASLLDLRSLGSELDPIPLADADAQVGVRTGERSSGVPLLWPLLRRRRVVLTGQPGAGKSTVLARLAADLPDVDERLLPILARLQDVDNLEHSASFRDRVIDAATRDVPVADRALVKASMERGLDDGSAVLILDGLDETYERRSDVTEELRDFVNDVSPDVMAVLSTRDVAYANAATLKWAHFSTAEPEDVDALIVAVLTASHEAAATTGDARQDDEEWVVVRHEWVNRALAGHHLLVETPLITVLLALLAGARDFELLPTSRAAVLAAAIDRLVHRQGARTREFRLGTQTDRDAELVAERAFRTIATTLVANNGQARLSVVTDAVCADLSDYFGPTLGPMRSTAEAAVRFWDDHGIFVANGRAESVSARIPMFAEIGDAIAAKNLPPADLSRWIADRIGRGAIEPLLLVSELNPTAAQAFLNSAATSGEAKLLHGAIRARRNGAVLDAAALEVLRDGLRADAALGDSEGWQSLTYLFTEFPDPLVGLDIDGLVTNFPDRHQVLARSVAQILDSGDGISDDEAISVLEAGQPAPLDSRTGESTDWLTSDPVRDLWEIAVLAAANQTAGTETRAADAANRLLDHAPGGTASKLFGVLEAAGVADPERAPGRSFRKTLENLSFGLTDDDPPQLLTSLSTIAEPVALTLRESTELPVLASVLETMRLNDASAWGKSFLAHAEQLATVLLELAEVDQTRFAAEVDVALDRVRRMDDRSAFWSLFEDANELTLHRWDAVANAEGAADLFVSMLSWGVGSAWCAAAALWTAPASVAELVVPTVRARVSELTGYTRHQRIAALTLCRLAGGPEPESWVNDPDPTLRCVAAECLDPTVDGALTSDFEQLLADPDRNVVAQAVKSLEAAEFDGRTALLERIAHSPEPGWTCSSCQTQCPPEATSCAASSCFTAPGHPARVAQELLDLTP